MLSVGRDLYFITLKLLARCFSPACARRSITMRNLLLLQSSSEKLCGHLVWPWANQLYLRCQVGDLAAEEQVHVRGILFCVRARARPQDTNEATESGQLDFFVTAPIAELLYPCCRSLRFCLFLCKHLCRVF